MISSTGAIEGWGCSLRRERGEWKVEACDITIISMRMRGIEGRGERAGVQSVQAFAPQVTYAGEGRRVSLTPFDYTRLDATCQPVIQRF